MHLIGASGHAKVIVDILKRMKINITGVWDDNESVLVFQGIKVSGGLNDFPQDQKAIIAIGNNKIREKIARNITSDFGIAIHPSANIAERTQIGQGTVVMAGVSVNADVIVGRHVILNTNSSVDHDCSLGDFVHISPNAALAGNVSIGSGTHIGIGACVIQNVKIGSWCTIGAGTVVIRDVPDYATVVGNPGRIIKQEV